MPTTARTRLAIAIAALLVATLVIFSVIARAVDTARLAARHQIDNELLVQARAESLAVRLRAEFDARQLLTTEELVDAANPVPVATALLRGIVDETGWHTWVLDSDRRFIYNSFSVRMLNDSARAVLDSVVAFMQSGSGIGENGAVRRIEGARVEHVATLNYATEPLLYSALLSLPQSVQRVVVARFPPEPPPSDIDFVVPILIAVPLIVIVAAGAAGVAERVAVGPAERRIGNLINEVEAISDGRSLHRRLALDQQDQEGRLSRLTDTLNAMIARLEQSFGGLRRFTADASHELKTPLTVLRADVERAMAATSDRGEQMVALEEALAETTRMADLVDSLLTLARADEGRFDLFREPVDLEALTRDVFETAVLLGERTRIRVHMPPPAKVTVLGDRARLRQLFLNLITNAIKYTPPKGEVDLSLARVDNSAHFVVRDTGIGIAAADLPRVFDRFWRADRARSRVGERGGFGLGLAISQYIAHAHGGSLTVKSRLGRGTTFTVELPLETHAELGGEK